MTYRAHRRQFLWPRLSAWAFCCFQLLLPSLSPHCGLQTHYPQTTALGHACSLSFAINMASVRPLCVSVMATYNFIRLPCSTTSSGVCAAHDPDFSPDLCCWLGSVGLQKDYLFYGSSPSWYCTQWLLVPGFLISTSSWQDLIGGCVLQWKSKGRFLRLEEGPVPDSDCSHVFLPVAPTAACWVREHS
ncbi:uncharacterized protein AKAME5_002246800 [Lates japonicus]|uniref:Uncharacterized protein n=1 Tax=Lates japonicus TaxID=270547 RepID=A0AAD3RJU6_LATJO|nr:uncharacterized protein AKAME5_002246800 [Lates japonicus]